MRDDWHDLGGGLTEGSDDSVSLQPLARIDDVAEWAWASDWLVAILGRESVPVTPEVKERLFACGSYREGCNRGPASNRSVLLHRPRGQREQHPGQPRRQGEEARHTAVRLSPVGRRRVSAVLSRPFVLMNSANGIGKKCGHGRSRQC